jgi:alpha-amylase/alpha-mannosidase (GH57 family)
LTSIKGLEQESSDPQVVLHHLTELEAIATEANHLHCQLNIPEGKPTLEQLILRSLWQLLHDPNSATLAGDIRRIDRLIELGNQLHLGLSLDRCQELYFSCLSSHIIPQFSALNSEQHQSSELGKHTAKTNGNTLQLRQLLQLGEKLAVDVSFWLSQLY